MSRITLQVQRIEPRPGPDGATTFTIFMRSALNDGTFAVERPSDGARLAGRVFNPVQTVDTMVQLDEPQVAFRIDGQEVLAAVLAAEMGTPGRNPTESEIDELAQMAEGLSRLVGLDPRDDSRWPWPDAIRDWLSSDVQITGTYQAIHFAVMALARALGLGASASCAPTEAQLERLARCGFDVSCEMLLGYMGPDATVPLWREVAGAWRALARAWIDGARADTASHRTARIAVLALAREMGITRG